jgi:hypothetical protein
MKSSAHNSFSKCVLKGFGNSLFKGKTLIPISLLFSGLASPHISERRIPVSAGNGSFHCALNSVKLLFSGIVRAAVAGKKS